MHTSDIMQRPEALRALHRTARARIVVRGGNNATFQQRV